MKDSTVTLRKVRDELGSRLLTATLSEDGTLTFIGQDIGQGVELAFGSGNIEYEWAWTIHPIHVPKLIAALELGDDVLNALATRYSNDAASN